MTRRPHMCPQCGRAFAYSRLIPRHRHRDAVCPGSEQVPRSAEGDMRDLWSGEPSPARVRAEQARA